jgi:hypothetical protein
MMQAEDKFRSRELDIMEKQVDLRWKADDKNINRQATTDDKNIELKESVVQLEREQLYLETGPGNAKEVKNL